MLDIINKGMSASLSVSKKSPINFWLSALVNVFYYLMQGLFWFSLLRLNNSSEQLNIKYISFFFATLCVVDNLYMLFFESGSFLFMKKVSTKKIDAFMTLPIGLPFLFTVTNISFQHIFLTIISLTCLTVVHFYYSTGLVNYFLHLIVVVQGVTILCVFTWTLRMSIFWSNALVHIKLANPAYKVLVRPEQSFDGIIRFIFTFVFPFLFITGIPTSIVVKDIGKTWVLGQSIMLVAMTFFSVFIYRKGLKRYAKFIT